MTDERIKDLAATMGIDAAEIDTFVENTRKYSESFPTFYIPEDGTKVYATFESDEVRTGIQTKFGDANVTTVIEDDGTKSTLWLKPKGIAARAYVQQKLILGKKQGKELGDIAGQRFAFWKDDVDTEKYGIVKGVRMQQVSLPKVEDLAKESESEIVK